MSILLAAALVPPLFLMYRVYQMDKIEKEPTDLIVKLFLFGALTVIPAAILENVFISGLTAVVSPYSYLYMAIENFLCVALVEEFVKYVALKRISWKHPAFDYCFDGVVYAVSASLGFAAAENIMYVFGFGGMATAVMRAVTAIPGHCIFGIFMGYYYGMAKACEARGELARSKSYRWLAVLMPMLLHGFYDFCASSESEILILVFYAYVIILDLFAIRSIKSFSGGDTHI